MSTSSPQLVSFLSPCHVTSLLFFSLYPAPPPPHHPQVSANLLLADACFALGKFSRAFPARITHFQRLCAHFLCLHALKYMARVCSNAWNRRRAGCGGCCGRCAGSSRRCRCARHTLQQPANCTSHATARHLTCATCRDAAAASGGQSGVGA